MSVARAAGVGVLLGVLWLSPVHGAGPSAKAAPHDASDPPLETRTVRLSIPDVPVVTQDGRSVRFVSDLVAGKTVAMNFIYTTCPTVCPLLAVTFRGLQDVLGERLGREVFLISVSVDPVTDTPERLKAWGAKFEAGAGWTLVTGAKPDITRLLRALGAATARKEDHPPVVLIRSGATGLWTRAYGLAAPAQLARLVEAASRPPRTAGPGREAGP